jgi:hypothetical protein
MPGHRASPGAHLIAPGGVEEAAHPQRGSVFVALHTATRPPNLLGLVSDRDRLCLPVDVLPLQTVTTSPPPRGAGRGRGAGRTTLTAERL